MNVTSLSRPVVSTLNLGHARSREWREETLLLSLNIKKVSHKSHRGKGSDRLTVVSPQWFSIFPRHSNREIMSVLVSVYHIVREVTTFLTHASSHVWVTCWEFRLMIQHCDSMKSCRSREWNSSCDSSELPARGRFNLGVLTFARMSGPFLSWVHCWVNWILSSDKLQSYLNSQHTLRRGTDHWPVGSAVRCISSSRHVLVSTIVSIDRHTQNMFSSCLLSVHRERLVVGWKSYFWRSYI